MTWLGKVKGGATGYFSLLKTGAKGAANTESLRQTGQIAGEAVTRLKMRPCPRCLEASLQAVEGGFKCVREDICGFQGSKEDLQQMRESTRIDPRVIALAKGFTGSFKKRAGGAAWMSRMLWAVTLCIVAYGALWMVMGHLMTGVWAMLVGVASGLHAIRYAYMKRRLEGSLESASQFLRSPGRWII